jgi:hypothetical protein
MLDVTMAVPGKTRTVWYSLCGKCFKRHDKVEAAEKAIEKHFRAFIPSSN